MILAIIGEKLSGKDSVVNYFLGRPNSREIKFSFILDEVLDVLRLPKSRDNEIAVATALREPFGEAVLMQRIIDEVRGAKDDELILLNGLRMPEEFRVAREMGYHIMYVTADTKIRFERYQKRREKTDDNVMNYEEFVVQDAAGPTEKCIPELGCHANFMVTNNGTMEELHKQLDQFSWLK